MAEIVLLIHQHLSHQHLPPYLWGELKHEHKTGVSGVLELPLQRSVPTKLYTSLHPHQFHSGKYTVMGSCVLTVSAIEGRSIPSINISIDPRSTSRSILHQDSIDISVDSRSQSTNFRRHAIECRSILAVITPSLSVDTRPTYRSLPYGRLSVACR